MEFAYIIRQGEKEYTSDAISVVEDGDCTCFSVADGKDTPRGAELTVNTVGNAFKSLDAISKQSVESFFKEADKVLKDDEERLKSAFAFLLTDGSVGIWGNIGDCRVYILRDKLLYEITPDHSEAYALYEAGDIRYPKIRRQKTRYNLTRMLGEEYNAEPSISQPEVIKAGDGFLLCSDGFWENIHELQIEKCLKKSSSAQNWLDRMMKIVDKNIQYKKYTRFKDSLCAITVKI